MKEILQIALQGIVRDFAAANRFDLPKDFPVEIDISKDPTHGDLTTPVAFRLAKLAGQKPAAIAGQLVLLFEKQIQVKKELKTAVLRWETAGGGFINFFVPAAGLGRILLEIHRQDLSFGASDAGKGKKVLMEFVSANPTGPLTIAHGRQAAVGDALARILKATGHEVATEYYLNDRGRQITLLGESLFVRYQNLLGRKVSLPEEGYQGEYLLAVAEALKKQIGEKLLREDRQKAVEFCSEFAAQEILKQIGDDLKSIGVRFDSYFSEKSLRHGGKIEKAIELLKAKGLIYEKDNALWFRSTEYGDDKDRVLRKQSGEYTYLAPDIAYHWTKFERGFNRIINFWGPDHHGYVQRLKAACDGLGHASEQVTIRLVQLTTLYRKGEPVRMSTRAGEFVTLRELFEEVGPDVTRFFFLLRRIESHLDFDLDLAKKQSDENPVFYLQYAHARISSILKFAKKKINLEAPLDRLGHPEEVELIKRLQEYPRALVQAAEKLEPYRVGEYLRELAAQFHKFYAHCRVVTEDELLTDARLLLADSVRIVLRNGLETLGISHPESM